MTDAGRTLGQTLRAAREAKRWDVARAERETRIRSHYLAALEEGDYADLPSDVYTRGFIRNYATYLGLDPEACLELYRHEVTPAVAARPPVAPPKPIVVEKRDAIITRGRVAAAGLVILVVAFIAYLAFQFLTFAGTPELTLTDPATDLPAYAGTSYILRGTTVPNARITVDGLRENPTTTASAEGAFTLPIPLVPGSNVVTLLATDPVTGRTSNPVRRTITVTLDGSTPGADGGPAVSAPEQDAVIVGPVAVSGTAAPGAGVTIRPTLVVAPTPSFTVTNVAGQTVTVPPWSPPAVDPVTVGADLSGAFTAELDLGVGTWDLRLTSGPSAGATPAPSEAAPAETVRRVTVVPPSGLSGTLEIRDAAAYLELEEDGVPRAGVSGLNAAVGTRLVLSAETRIRIRTADAGRVHLVLNGYTISPLGAVGATIEWRIDALVPGG